jgi:hypothetical protein
MRQSPTNKITGVICVTVTLALTSKPLAAQVLPEGIGAVAIGHRQYTPTGMQYDQSGKLRSLGSLIDMDFDSRQMASGALGKDLKRLYDELKKFDSANTGSASLAEQLSFGKLRGTVDAKIQAQYLGTAYGLFDNFTVFAGIPFVKSTVTADITMHGENTAGAIKSRLGNLAFKEIRDGLKSAEDINVFSIKQKISDDYGYVPADKWEYAGIGDLMIGARSNLVNLDHEGAAYSVQFTGQVEFPTGHSDNPDILTDAPLSKGYISPMVSALQTISYSYIDIGLDTGFGLGLPRETVRRVPVDNESLITADRKTTVKWSPGMDTRVVASISVGPSVIKGSYRLGVTKHHRDRYSGNLSGNYRALERSSETSEKFHEFGVTINTVDAFLSKRFALPIIASITAHDSLSGRNTIKSKYIELSIATLFKGHARDQTSTAQSSPTATTFDTNHQASSVPIDQPADPTLDSNIENNLSNKPSSPAGETMPAKYSNEN